MNGKPPLVTLFTLYFLLATFLSGAEREVGGSLRESTVMEVVNLVEILRGPDLEAHSAEPGQRFREPDLLQTGRRSRARLEADDGTVLRVGSNTLFSFAEQDRSIHLDRGALLFHSPEGRGGGTITTASATAAVMGTTLMVVATVDGGFKVLVLEGTVQITYQDGTIRQLGAGQMTFVQPDRPETAGAGPVIQFDLEALTEHSALMNGFDQGLASTPQIQEAIQRQRRNLDTGALTETGTLILHAERDTVFGLDLSDSNTLATIAREIREREPPPDREAAEDGGMGPAASGDADIFPLPREPTPEPVDEDLLRLREAAQTNFILSEGFPEEAFFDAPGVDVPEGEFPTRPEAFTAEGFFGLSIQFSGGFIPGSDGHGQGSEGSIDIGSILIRSTDGDSVFILGIDAIAFTGNQTFAGFTGPTTFTLETDGTMSFPVETAFTLQGDGPVDWSLIAANDLVFNNNWVDNSLGGSLTVESTEGNLIDNFSTFSSSESVALIAETLVQLDGTTIGAPFIEIRAGQDINANDLRFNPDLSDAELSMRAGNLLEVRNTNLTMFDRVRMAADTIALTNIQFATNSSLIDLRSRLGLLADNPNTGQPVASGYVNFIQGVTVNGIPAQNFVSDQVGGNATGPALIQIAPRN